MVRMCRPYFYNLGETRAILKKRQVEYDDPIPIYCDNTSAISISKNPVMHSKTKHIPIKYHFLREQVAENNIKVEYVGTKEQVADILQNHFHGKPLNIFAKDLELFLLQK
jgi:hypothetical protein